MKVKNIKSNIDYNYFNLEVSYNDVTRTLTVFSNSFRIAGMDYELTEDEQYIVPICDVHTFIYGHVVEQEDGTIRFLFDAVSDVDPPANLAAMNLKDFGRFITIETMNNDAPMITVYHLVDTSEEETAEAAIVDFYRKVGLLGKDIGA